MVSVLRDSIGTLENLGFINLLIPFIFCFIIIFAVLEKTKVFGLEKGKTKKNLNSMTAFIISFIFIASFSRVQTLNIYLQFLGMALVFVMSVLFLFAGFQQKTFFQNMNYVYLISLIFVVIGFFYITGIVNNEKYTFILDLLFNPVVIIVVVFYVLIMFITGTEKKGKSSGRKTPIENTLESHGAEEMGRRTV